MSEPGDLGPVSDAASYPVDGVVPTDIERPASVEALSTVLGDAEAAGQAVVLQGGRTAVGIGNVPSRYDLALDLSALDQVISLEPEDFTITVEAGMAVSTLQLALAAHGQFVPLDVARAEQSTVGGLVARGRGGPRRARFGSVRDWLIGTSMVLADGTLIKGGGRVVKNVSGFDLPKLFAGSFGTLGAIVQATFKVRPMPAVDVTIVHACPDVQAAAKLSLSLSRSRTLDAAVALDAASASAAGLGDGGGGGGGGGATLALRVAGVREAVESELAALQSELSGSTPEASDPNFWQAISDLEFVQSAKDRGLLRLGGPVSIQNAVYQAALEVTADEARVWGYADSGLVFVSLEAGAIAAVSTSLRERFGAQGLSVIVDAAPPELKAGIDIWGGGNEGIEIMREIKRRFDPKSTLSPGRFVGGI